MGQCESRFLSSMISNIRLLFFVSIFVKKFFERSGFVQVLQLLGFSLPASHDTLVNRLLHELTVDQIEANQKKKIMLLNARTVC